jgi:hypothetical protein
LRKSDLCETAKVSARVDCLNVLERFRNRDHPKWNRNEFKTLKEIREMEVLIMKPDKGKGVVILDKDDYEDRMLITLNEGPYEEVKKDGRWKDGNPIHKLEMEVLTLLKVLKEKKGLSQNLYRSLIVSNPKMPVMYGLPKVHKIGRKMRPIISNIKTPTSKISKYVTKRFEELQFYREFSIKNSFEFIEKTKDLIIGENEMLVSFDVVGLFPNIPLEEAFNGIKDFLATKDLSENEKEILMKLSKICMEQNIFQYRDKFYRQKSGAAIGNSASPIISEFFMDFFEKKLKNENWFPRVWIRYVDDVFAVIERDKLDLILTRLNSFYQTIQFTSETENEGQIPFLDLKLTRRNDGSVEFEIYRKPTDSQLFIREDSFHHQSQKHAAFHSMFFRLFKVPMSQGNFKKEKDYIMETGRKNGFAEKTLMKIFEKHRRKSLLQDLTSLRNTEREELQINGFVGIPFFGALTENLKRKLWKYGVKVGFQNPGKISDHLKPLKDKCRDHEMKSGIYRLRCADCDVEYYGLTKRRLGVRKREHMADCLKPLNEESAMAFHCISENHTMRSEIELMREVDEPHKLSVWESLFLHKNRNQNLANIYKEGNSPSILYEAI